MDSQASSATPHPAASPATGSISPALGTGQKHSHWYSFLERIGHFGLEAVTKILPTVKIAAQDIEPEFDLLFPLEGPVFNSVVQAICTVEMASGANTTGETKLQSVMGLVGSTLKGIAASQNLPLDQVEPAIRRYIDGLVALLNSPARIRSLSPAGVPAAPAQTAVPVSAAESPTAIVPHAANSTMRGQSGPPAGPLEQSGHESEQQSEQESGLESAQESAPESAQQTSPPPEPAPAPAPTPTPAPAPNSWPNSVIDLSHHNGTVDLDQAAAAGITAVLHKATQGNLFVDPAYEANLEKALAAGLLWGAYHFGIGEDGVIQAKHFLETVHPGPSTVMALDLETNRMGPSMTLEEARAFVLYVHQQTGRWPGIYGGYYLKQLLAGKSDPVLANCWLWLSQYDDKPAIPSNWKTWTLWQYTDGTYGIATDPVPGVGICDRSYFNGSVANLASRWAAGSLG